MDNGSPIVAAVVIGVIFLAGREFVCWYFKINETNQLLRDIRRGLGAEPTTPPQALPRWLVGAPRGTYDVKPKPTESRGDNVLA